MNRLHEVIVAQSPARFVYSSSQVGDVLTWELAIGSAWLSEALFGSDHPWPRRVVEKSQTIEPDDVGGFFVRGDTR
ncbi:hypothetical protein GM1_037_00070 [Gordonia malaquae NBRC 108250]|uniref:Uncharacterized protein n=1 Tax=Gordonia malaquae NBRC 108250 TaxID=1223542 RepID=M3TJ46_GORML|nr:hypothetical protein GM1_037_00070 [Gordonia malaquae NBRC 108250]